MTAFDFVDLDGWLFDIDYAVLYYFTDAAFSQQTISSLRPNQLLRLRPSTSPPDIFLTI